MRKALANILMSLATRLDDVTVGTWVGRDTLIVNFEKLIPKDDKWHEYQALVSFWAKHTDHGLEHKNNQEVYLDGQNVKF